MVCVWIAERISHGHSQFHVRLARLSTDQVQRDLAAFGEVFIVGYDDNRPHPGLEVSESTVSRSMGIAPGRAELTTTVAADTKSA